MHEEAKAAADVARIIHGLGYESETLSREAVTEVAVAYAVEVRREVLEKAAKVAAAHRPDRTRPLAAWDPEDREIVRAEENGEAIAASVIASAIRTLQATPDA